MNKMAVFVVVAIGGSVGSVRADYSVADRGEWPATWPRELDALRGQVKTFEGPLVPYLWYSIPFTNRDEFEAAWPHLLKAKSEGAPVFLVQRTRTTDFFGVKPAGVLVHAPPAGSTAPEAPLAGATDPQTKWANTTYLELVVDGEIVDLNRIRLPKDTPIVDERFDESN